MSGKTITAATGDLQTDSEFDAELDGLYDLADFTVLAGLTGRELPDVEREAARAAGFSGPYAARFAGWPVDRCAQGAARMSLDWMSRAACRDHHPDTWFPPKTGPHNAARAQQICAACPVIAQCAGYADTIRASDGIWAGRPRQTHHSQRLTLTVRGRPPKPCGTEAAYWRHRRHNEKPCPDCTLARTRADQRRVKARSGRKR